MQIASTTLWLTLLFVGVSYQARAQTDFRPGYVVPLTGDTLRGEVDQRDARLSAQRCRFRPQAGAAVTTYLPAQARAYGLASGGAYYRVQAVPAGDSLLAPGTLYFMEVLADGPTQLYFLRSDRSRETYYVVSPALPLALLKHELRMVMRDGRRYQEEQTPFRQALAQALAGCAVAQTKLPTLAYAESALRRVVQLYNTCQGAGPSKRAASPAALVAGVGIAGGVYRGQLLFNGLQLKGPKFPPYTGFTGGLTLSLGARRTSRKVSMELGAFYERQRYDVDYIEPYSGGIVYERHSRVQLDLTYVYVPVLVRYIYPRGKVQPLAEAGVILRRVFFAENTYQTTNYQGAFTAPEPFVSVENTKWPEVNFGAGVGLMTRVVGNRPICLLMRAETGRDVLAAAASSATQFSLKALLSVNITK